MTETYGPHISKTAKTSPYCPPRIGFLQPAQTLLPSGPATRDRTLFIPGHDFTLNFINNMMLCFSYKLSIFGENLELIS